MGNSGNNDKIAPKLSDRSGYIILTTAVGMIGSVVGFGAAQYFNYWELDIKERSIQNEVLRLKVQIVSEIKDTEFGLAEIMMDYLLEPLEVIDGKVNASFSAFRVNIERLMAERAPTAAAKNVPLPSEVSLPGGIPDAEKIRDVFSGDDRLNLSSSLVSLYKDHPKEVVEELVSAIVPPSGTELNSYRINLYIIFTLARMPTGWVGTQEQYGRIEELGSTANAMDSTFKARLREALDNFVLADN